MGLEELKDLNESAVQALKDCLDPELTPSADIRRKAAMDVLTVNQVVGAKRAPVPTVTDEQLNLLGRVIREVEGIPRELESAERKVGRTALAGPG